MSYLGFVRSSPLFLILYGCGSSVPAATTRVLAADSALLSQTPICFVRPNPEWNLTQVAEQTNNQALCASAAQKQGLRVVPIGKDPCLAVTMVWSSRATGQWDEDCSRTILGAECSGSSVHAKSLKVILNDSTTGKVVAESTAAIHSDYGEFSRRSIQALCSAAFHDFPQPLSNAQFDVSLD